MAEGDQFVGSLGRLDSCQACHLKQVALGELIGGDSSRQLRRNPHTPLGNGAAGRGIFVTDIDHRGTPGGIHMAELVRLAALHITTPIATVYTGLHR